MKRLAIITALLLCVACTKREEQYQSRVTTGGGDADRGKQLMSKYGCIGCHVIPGVQGPRGMVGPPLDKMGARSVLAGKFANNPENMMRWLQNPQAMDPNVAMPNVGVTPADARDMSAYLFTLK
jgi:cytochrome c